MKNCPLCSLCRHEERRKRDDCIFQPYRAMEESKIKGLDNTFSVSRFQVNWECLDFKPKQEVEYMN